MPVNQGFPGAQRLLTSAVRKALFTSAAATAIAVGTPGYAAAAEIACAPGNIGMPAAGDSVHCSGAFDETIAYDVVDTTVVNGSVEPGDVTVVVAEGSSTTGIQVSSVTPAADETVAQGSVVIENHGAIDQSGDSSIVLDPSYVKTYTDVALRFSGEARGGINYTHTLDLDENGRTIAGTEKYLADGGVDASEIVDYFAAQGIDVSGESFSKGRQDELTIVVAPKGTFDFDDVAAISATTDAGDIAVENTGDISLGNGLAIDYYTRVSETSGSTWKALDLDGDGESDVRLVGQGSEIFVSSSARMTTRASVVGIDAASVEGNISIANAGDINAGDVAYGVRTHTDIGDITIENTGDITLGADSTGIQASTAAHAELAHEYNFSVDNGVSFDDGNPGVRYKAQAYYHNTTDYFASIYNADASDSKIQIANAGSITVGAGSAGISAENPSGDAIIIENSGDIMVGAGEGGAGITASAMAGFESSYTVTPDRTPGCGFIRPCEPLPYTYYSADGSAPNRGQEGFNAYGSYYTNDLNEDGVETPTRHYFHNTVNEGTGYVADKGDITIVNSGSIDISAATGAKGIHAATFGVTEIENSGQIIVGNDSTGISTDGAGETLVINSGDIQVNGTSSDGINVFSYVRHAALGNGSITFEEIYGAFTDESVNAAYAGFGGDTTVYNTGTISGNNDAAEALEINEAGALVGNINAPRSIGIHVISTNSNLKGSDVRLASYGQESLDAYYADRGVLLETRDNIELFDTTVVNTGDIAMGDLSEGMRVSATYGDVTVVNSGSVSVGSGVLVESAGNYSATRSLARGVVADPGGLSWSNNTVVNTAEGTITGGDLAHGMAAVSDHGDAIVINDGSVVVGNGGVIEASDHRETDFVINAVGLNASTVLGLDAYVGATNNGTVTTGDHSFGILAQNSSGASRFTSAFGHSYTAAAINAGQVNTGDNSIGLGVMGISNLGYNTGEITIGSGDAQIGSEAMAAAGMKTVGGLLGSQYSALVNLGSITTGDDASGIDAEALVQAVAFNGESGQIVTGDDTIGMRSVGYIRAINQNAGSIHTGDDSIGTWTYAINAATFNSGDIEVGDDSRGIHTIGSQAYVRNDGNVTVGDNGTAIKVQSVATGGTVINQGSIRTGGNSVAIEMIGNNDETIVNMGDIHGSILTGDGDDLLVNDVYYNSVGNIVGAGRNFLDDAVIDMGAGQNTFINVFGDIVFSGDSTIDLGADGLMQNYSRGESYVTISSLNGEVGDTLTINGDVNFTSIQGKNGMFLVDVSSMGNDSIVINGDLTVDEQLNAEGDTRSSSLNVAMSVNDQGKGEHTSEIIQVNGESDLDGMVVAAIGGDFADTVLSAEILQNDSGNWEISYTSGLSQLGAAASAVSHLAESSWMRSSTAFMDAERSASASEGGRVEGLHAWSTMLHTDSDIVSKSDLASQDLSYTQLLNNQMAGATYNTKIGGSWLSISPMVGQGSADGSQLTQQSSTALDTQTLGLNAGWSMGDFYVNALYQSMEFDAHIRAHDSAANTEGKAQGVSLEGGWTYLMESGIAMTPFAQWSDVKSEIDDFTSSDGNFDYAYNLGSTTNTRLGLNMRKSFKLSDGFAMPYATFSVVDGSNHDAHDLHSNGVVFNSDVSGTGFNVDVGVDGKYKLWTIKSGLGVHTGETDKNGISGHFSISRSL